MRCNNIQSQLTRQLDWVCDYYETIIVKDTYLYLELEQINSQNLFCKKLKVTLGGAWQEDPAHSTG